MKGFFHLFVSGRYLLAAPLKGSTFALALCGGTAAGRSEAAAPAQLLWDPQGEAERSGGGGASARKEQKKKEEETQTDSRTLMSSVWTAMCGPPRCFVRLIPPSQPRAGASTLPLRDTICLSAGACGPRPPRDWNRRPGGRG